MSNGSLSEQMGAMALVDELRLQQRQVQEHLDLALRRAEIVERIRGYYQRQGIACDDSLIEQGVREFFARRLRFESPQLSWPHRLLAGMLLRRRLLAWGGLTWVALLGGALLTANLRQPGAPTRPTEVSAPANKGLGVPAPAWTKEADRAAHQARLDQYTQLMARLEAMPLPEDVRAKLLPFARSTGALVADHGPAKAIQALRELQVYVDYTEAQLQLRIPDGAGQISGYERCRKTSACQPGSEDGKAWFLVFQARDPQGKVVAMPLANGHTGAIALADSLGVQVTHAQYLKAQQVKQAKGRVDNPVIGRKDAYNLSRHFDNRVFAGSSFDNPADTNQSIVSASF